ncbi:hypothetical protein NDU88_007213 [Pleurodeles waltl]|uniref:Uncharacterized protein n=1 Tax=Pleurodeles waltl TaxID=8319 RepID=A0AAV7LUS4_PLEWA|nr:hypothetical protein NDU88_007213 [Pleurodeles waltl]
MRTSVSGKYVYSTFGTFCGTSRERVTRERDLRALSSDRTLGPQRLRSEAAWGALPLHLRERKPNTSYEGQARAQPGHSPATVRDTAKTPPGAQPGNYEGQARAPPGA